MKAASFWKISVLVPSMIAISGVAIVWHAYKIRSNNLQLAEQARTLRIRAGQGDPQAQYALGLLYYQGKGTPRDYAEALQWYRKAAAQSDAKTQEALGSMYYYGRGVQQDSAEAARWYRLAANQGHARAQFDLGYLYYYGQGVPQDRAEAVRWYQKAANQGDEYAQRAIGLRGPGLSTRGAVGLSAIILGYLWVLKDCLFLRRSLENRQERALLVSGLLGLAFVGLSLYGDFGVFHSLLAVSVFNLTKNLVVGTSIAGLISVFGPKSSKLVLGISATLFTGMNLFVIAHHDLRRFASTVRGFSLVNGLLLGISIPTAIFLWRKHKKSTGATYQLDPADRA